VNLFGIQAQLKAHFLPAETAAQKTTTEPEKEKEDKKDDDLKSGGKVDNKNADGGAGDGEISTSEPNSNSDDDIDNDDVEDPGYKLDQLDEYSLAGNLICCLQFSVSYTSIIPLILFLSRGWID
jgi:hypothetical protein